MPFATTALGLIVAVILGILLRRLFLTPLRAVPGPLSYAVSSWRLAFEDLKGHTTRKVHRLHTQYGPAVRIGPAHVSFNSPMAVKAIYGTGSQSQRTSFYKLFEPYGRPTMFSMSAVEGHRRRKQCLARPFAKTNILRGYIAKSIESKVNGFMQLLKLNDYSDGCEIGRLLAFFALDVASAFVYGSVLGTAATACNLSHQAILSDYDYPHRRELSFLGVHGASTIKTRVLALLYGEPIHRHQISAPSPFTHIRTYAMEACKEYQSTAPSNQSEPAELALISQLSRSDLDDMDIASECADGLLAGVETTKNALLFLVWALSLPKNKSCQDKLRQEMQHNLASTTLNEHGLLTVGTADTLPYLNAVLKESLRLYAPLPASQPRFFESDTVIDGYSIPARTVVSIAPYCLHHNATVFQDPYDFVPERWLQHPSPEMESLWWPYSSGARGCTGLQ